MRSFVTEFYGAPGDYQVGDIVDVYASGSSDGYRVVSIKTVEFEGGYYSKYLSEAISRETTKFWCEVPFEPGEQVTFDNGKRWWRVTKREGCQHYAEETRNSERDGRVSLRKLKRAAATRQFAEACMGAP
jgi:hypothetical protein